MSPESTREAAFAAVLDHIAALGGQADLSRAIDPLDQFVTTLRHIVKRYGDVGPAPSLQGIQTRSASADGVPAEWVLAQDAPHSHRLVYIHGGGWCAGAPQDYRGIASTLARLSGASVLVIDYRLAPEHRFPAGLDDCVRALAWAATHDPEGGLADAAHLSVVGDSAGAGLAAGMVLEIISRGQRIPDRLALIAGTLDNLPYPERVGLRDAIVTPQSLAAAVACYLGAGATAHDPRISPIFASREALAQFPPTLLQASNIETLLQDTHDFAARLEQVGVHTVRSIWPGLPHVWHAFLGLFPEASAALQEIADFVRPHPLRT